MNSSQLAHGGTAWRTDLGRLGVWLPMAGVLVVAMHGNGARDFAPPILEAYERLPRSAPIHLFFDFEHLVDYDPPLRTELVLRFVPDRQRIRGTYVLVGPHPSAMIGAATKAFRELATIVSERAQFEALLDERLSGEGVREFSSSLLRPFAEENR